MERDTKTEKKSKRIGTPPKSFYTPIDNGSQTGQFGTDRKWAEELKHKLRRLTRDLEGVDLVELKMDFIRRRQIGRNDADYRVMLAICELLLQREVPTETTGSHKLPGLDRDALTLYRIYNDSLPISTNFT